MQFTILKWTFVLAAMTAMASAQAVPARPSLSAGYGKLPITFESNHGQTDPHVKFVSHGPGYTAFLTSDSLVLSLRANESSSAHSNAASRVATPSSRASLQFQLIGAAKHSTIVGEQTQAGHVNYFIGNNPAKWQRNVPTYKQVRYKNVYPGIDLLYYGNSRQLEYDFAVAPGADPAQVHFAIHGANNIHTDAAGNLILNTGGGELRFQTPVVYQEQNGHRVQVNGGYVVDDSTHISFHVSKYDASKRLVIDPVLVYSTYLGGSGADQPAGIAVDTEGNVYVAGTTDSIDFPLTTRGSASSGNPDVFVAKLDSTGSNLIYADYLGGTSQDYGYGVAVDSTNNVYITGSTASSDFPMASPFQGTYPGSFNGFVSKISTDGASLLYSTYFGGNGSDVPSGIAVDASSQMTIAGNTTSTNLPVANAYQSTVLPNEGSEYGNYGFVARLSANGSALVFSTYFGGSSNVALNCGGTPCYPQPASSIVGLALDETGNTYVAGNTNTYNFPVTGGAYLTTNTTSSNASVGFVSKFDGAGSLQYSTYFYESSGLVTDITALAADASGSAYVTGLALSDGTFPVTSTSICDPGAEGLACNFGFVTKFDAAGANLSYSTFLGPNNNAVPQAIKVDANNNAYVVASSSGGAFTTVDAIQNFNSGNDAMIFEIDATASTQLFATYFGGSGNDQPAPSGLALDANGNIYVTGTTDSTDFPMTQGALQSVFGGNTDAFIAKIGAQSGAAVVLSPSSLQFADQAVSSTSAPQTVVLRNFGSAALSISSIAASSDFTETDDCGGSVAATGTCTLAITFAPTISGTHAGTVTINDDAIGSVQVITLAGNGLGAGVSLAPSSLSFGNISVGVTSAAQTVTLTNNGNVALSISSIATAGVFAQTNNCPSTLNAALNCTINVTFTPAAAGVSAGSLTISDNTGTGVQTVALTGTGVTSTSGISLVPAGLTFSSTAVGTTRTAQTLTLANNGVSTLAISTVHVTGDFAQTNNCPASLASAASCTISVTFTPSATGTRSGTVTITDSDAGSPQVVGLTGTGADFAVSSSDRSDTISVGSTATYTLTVAPVGGSFASAVTLACSGVPSGATCSISPNTVTPGSNSATVTVSIDTTSMSAKADSSRPAGAQPVYVALMQLQGLGLVGMLFAGSKRRSKKLTMLIALALLVGVMLFMSGCAGGTGVAPQNPTGPTSKTYTVTVAASSGSLQHLLPLTLTVQ